jgi:hypothetical protein
MSQTKKVNITFSKDFVDSVALSEGETFNLTISGKVMGDISSSSKDKDLETDESIILSSSAQFKTPDMRSFISNVNYPLNKEHSTLEEKYSLHTKEELIVRGGTSTASTLKYGLYDEKNKTYYLSKIISTDSPFSFVKFAEEIPQGTVSVVCEFRGLREWDGLSKFPSTVEKLYANFNKFESISSREFSQTNIKYLEVVFCNIRDFTNIHKTKLEIIDCENNPCFEEYKFYERKLSMKYFNTSDLRKKAIIQLIKNLHAFIDSGIQQIKTTDGETESSSKKDTTASTQNPLQNEEGSYISSSAHKPIDYSIEKNLDKINDNLKFGKITIYKSSGKNIITYTVNTYQKIYSFEDFVFEIPEGVTKVGALYKNITGWAGLKNLPKSVTNLNVRGNSFENLEGELSETNVEYLDIQSCNVKTLDGIQYTKIRDIEYANNPCEVELGFLGCSDLKMKYREVSTTSTHTPIRNSKSIFEEETSSSSSSQTKKVFRCDVCMKQVDPHALWKCQKKTQI